MADAPKVVPLPLNRARQQLVEEAQPFVRREARRCARRYGCDYDESVSVGNLALTEAARLYDHSHETPFVGFAFQRVRGAMLDAGGSARRIGRLMDREPEQILRDLSVDPDPALDEAEAQGTVSEMAEALAAAFIAHHGALAMAPSPEQELEALQAERSVHHTLRGAIDALDDEMRSLVEMHYFEGVALKNIAEQLGVTYRTLRRRHVDALRILFLRASRSD